jgi:hypothetical protein
MNMTPKTDTPPDNVLHLRETQKRVRSPDERRLWPGGVSFCGVPLAPIHATDSTHSANNLNTDPRLHGWVHFYTNATCVVCLEEKIERDSRTHEARMARVWARVDEVSR